MSLNNC